MAPGRTISAADGGTRGDGLHLRMTLQQLRVLVAVATAGTFGGAALDLGVSQGAVSQAVASLEKALGVRLFDRGSDGAALTPVGARIHAHALLALRMESAIREEVSLERGELRATLRVEALWSLSVHVLPGVLARLAERHPGVRVDVNQTKLDTERHGSLATVDALRAGGIEIGFLQLPIGDDAALDALLLWPVVREPYVAVVARRLLGPGDHAVDPARHDSDALLKRLPLALDVSAACAMLVTDYVTSRLGRCDARYRADDATILQLVAQGAAISVLPTSSVAALPDDVVRLELKDPPVRVLAVAITPPNLKAPAVRAFLGALGERFPEAGLPPGPALVAPSAAD